MRKPIAVVCLVLLAACADDPEPCTVTQGADGSATITCPDGSTAEVSGPQGEQGEPGDAGNLIPILVLVDKDDEIVPAVVSRLSAQKHPDETLYEPEPSENDKPGCAKLTMFKNQPISRDYRFSLSTGIPTVECQPSSERFEGIFLDDTCSGDAYSWGKGNIHLRNDGVYVSAGDVRVYNSSDGWRLVDGTCTPFSFGPTEGLDKKMYKQFPIKERPEYIFLSNPPYSLKITYKQYD